MAAINVNTTYRMSILLGQKERLTLHARGTFKEKIRKKGQDERRRLIIMWVSNIIASVKYLQSYALSDFYCDM